MALQIIPFAANRSFSVPSLGGQLQDRIDLAVGATATHTAPFPSSTVICRITAQENCYVRIGEGAVANATHSEFWPAGTQDDRLIATGHRISVVAAA